MCPLYVVASMVVPRLTLRLRDRSLITGRGARKILPLQIVITVGGAGGGGEGLSHALEEAQTVFF